MIKLLKNIAISESGFVFNPKTGDSFSLNNIGLHILNDLKQFKEVAEIRQGLLDKYDVDPLTLEKNLDDFFSMLRYYELVEENPKE